ncbi:meiotic nuclear division protein 1 homolog isoform X2 [Ctenocephalides felis]|uniref:meiotic nuclear division protein 1 homolog isoform X2 n=1 Tax=Ctenocephalides felis TaxID=7515 RepID=UPI000E6E135E|nr:meiotic nuclear division protein 1 homolog isoform X2 [Ctenocephalides felis]
MQELEKIAPKEKGIISQSVKDVIQNLVDDGLVDTDKIGTSVYFWAYPSKAKHAKKKAFAELSEKLEQLDKKYDDFKNILSKEQTGRVLTEQRNAMLQEIQKLRESESKLLEEIKKYQDSDPEAIELLVSETKLAKEATNRWTDNLFALKSYCKTKFFIEEAAINKQFGIPEDLDYIE